MRIRITRLLSKRSLRTILTYKNWLDLFLASLVTEKPRETILQLRNGVCYKLRNYPFGDRFIADTILIDGIYSELIKNIEDDSVVLDIGAHIGIFSILAAQKADNVKVYSYEPCSENFKLLEYNVQLNKLHRKIRLFKMGVCSKKSEKRLFIDNDNTGRHSLYRNFVASNHSEIMQCVGLTDVFDSNKIDVCDFVKMDCEGAEYDILYGTPRSYLLKIKNCAVKCHPNGNPHELKRYLEENDFQVWTRKTRQFQRNERMFYARNLKID